MHKVDTTRWTGSELTTPRGPARWVGSDRGKRHPQRASSRGWRYRRSVREWGAVDDTVLLTNLAPIGLERRVA